MNTLALFGGSVGGTEMLLIMVVALLLFGANNLPKIARSLGRAVEEFRRAAREVSDEVMKADLEDSRPAPLSTAATRKEEPAVLTPVSAVHAVARDQAAVDRPADAPEKDARPDADA